LNQTPFLQSELILNDNGSVYHLHLKPEHVARTIITVGDPDRVDDVTKHFDTIEFTIQKREFKTQTGTLNGKRFTVISTGIGTDNIDIVFNELDALVNIDLSTKKVKENITQLNIIRIGTSGAIQKEIPLDSFLVSEKAIGFDSLLHFYGNTDFLDRQFAEAFMKYTHWSPQKSTPYVVEADEYLLRLFNENEFPKGITATNVGFYAPQGRKLRLSLQDEKLQEKLQSFQYNNAGITNLEMETSGIYGMARLLGHRAISLNAILANRALGTFSTNPKQTIEKLITKTLDLLVHEEV
jgi:uridine phosphorylase